MIDHSAIYLGMNKVIHQPGPGGECCVSELGVYGLGGISAVKAVRLIEY